MLCSLVLVVGACTSSGELGEGDAATVADAGEVEVARGDTWEPLEPGATVSDGARLRTQGEEAHLVFRDATVRLSPRTEVGVSGDRVTVERGDVLVEDGTGLSLASGNTVVAGQGTFRLTPGVSARAAVYEGEATVERPAQSRTVPALRELDISSLRLPSGPVPLAYREADPWDRQLLAGAIAFDAEVARYVTGLRREVGEGVRAPAFYADYTEPGVVRVLAATAPVVVQRRFGPPADVLLTLFVAKAVAADERAMPETVRSVASLRDGGARWGLVAAELGVVSEDLAAAVDDGTERQTALVRRTETPRPDPGAPDDGGELEAEAPAETAAAGPAPDESSGGSPSGRRPSGDGDGGGGDEDTDTDRKRRPRPPPDDDDDADDFDTVRETVEDITGVRLPKEPPPPPDEPGDSGSPEAPGAGSPAREPDPGDRSRRQRATGRGDEQPASPTPADAARRRTEERRTPDDGDLGFELEVPDIQPVLETVESVLRGVLPK